MSSRDRAAQPMAKGPLRGRVCAGEALTIALSMARFAVRRNRRGVEDGVRALGALGREALSGGAAGDLECPVCGWRGAKFGPQYYVDHYREQALCYGCGAVERYRALALYLKTGLGGFFDEPRRVLDVAPPRFSRSLFPRGVDYLSFDLLSPLAMVRGDLTNAPLRSAAFDLWVCFHVLDVIPDDRAAMRELYRVLAPGGMGVLDHAMAWGRPTEEYGCCRPDQCLHRRRYGDDLPARLEEVGFEVELVDVDAKVAPGLMRRHGVPRRRFVVCRRPR